MKSIECQKNFFRGRLFVSVVYCCVISKCFGCVNKEEQEKRLVWVWGWGGVGFFKVWFAADLLVIFMDLLGRCLLARDGHRMSLASLALKQRKMYFQHKKIRHQHKALKKQFNKGKN